MHLIPIPRDGNVSLSDITLPAAAASVIASTVQLYARCGYVEPWVGYLAIEESNCVGCSGFTSPPVGGVAEIAYFTFPDFERRGSATRMVQRPGENPGGHPKSNCRRPGQHECSRYPRSTGERRP